MSSASHACQDDFHVRHHRVGELGVVHNRYPAHYALEEHEHAAATVYLVLRGGHEERSRGAVHECADGAVIFSPRGARHSDRYGKRGGEAFLIELPDGVLERAGAGGVVLDGPLYLDGGGAGSLLMRRLFDEARRDDDLTPFAFEALVLHLLAVLCRDAPRETLRIPGWLARVRELINDRFAERLSLADAAAAADVHPVHLASTFHRCYGVTFGAYLRRIRVEHARRSLAESDATVAEIALACGFFDQSHLSRVFREATGTSPAQYRRDVGRASARLDGLKPVLRG
ncbi:MAG TPA: AraC family transcriptional regulator [Thermoanaerobaculia bacterium]|nr:AraC family transcriptional regulator [Thermoanaerobaculia bacterium]